MPHNVFLSYKSEYRTSVNAIRVALEAEHISVWMDTHEAEPGHDKTGEIKPGDTWMQTIRNGLENCDLFVLVLTAACAGSHVTGAEITIASSLKKPILVIRLENYFPDKAPFDLVNAYQTFDAFPKPAPSTGLMPAPKVFWNEGLKITVVGNTDSEEIAAKPQPVDPYLNEIVALVRKKLRENNLSGESGRKIALSNLNSPVADIGSYVYQAMIKGVLIPTITGIAIKEGHEEGINRPFDFANLHDAPLRPDAVMNSLKDYFELAVERLVITGEKGAGKTILALQLVRELLPDPFRPQDTRAPIYVHVGSWVDPLKPVSEQQELKPWIKSWLVKEYHIDKKRAEELVERGSKGSLIYCFDGLDDLYEGGDNTNAEHEDLEAAERNLQYREALLKRFVNEVEKLASDTSVQVILVCSENLLPIVRKPELDLATIKIRPWSEADLLRYLNDRGLAKLAKFLDTKDEIRKRLIKNFFELQMLATIYTSSNKAEGLEAHASNVKEYFLRVYDLYVNTRYERYVRSINAAAEEAAQKPPPEGARPPTAEQISDIARIPYDSLKDFLPSIASYVNQDGQDGAFRLDNLQPTELPRKLRELYRMIAGLMIGAAVVLSAGMPVLISILMECVIYHRSPLRTLLQGCGGFFGYVLVGLIIGTAYRFWTRWKFGAGVGVAFGLGKGFASGFSVTVPGFHPGLEGGMHNGLTALVCGVPAWSAILQQSNDDPYTIAPIEMWDTDTSKIVYWIFGALAVGAVFSVALGWAKGLAVAVALGVFSFVRFGRRPRIAPVHLSPNQAIRYSARTAVRNGNLVAASTAIATGISYGIAYDFWDGVTGGVMAYSALVTLLFFGGMPVVKHWALLWTLRIAKLVPKELDCWLRMATNIGIMKQAGGSYVFSSGDLRTTYAGRLSSKEKLSEIQWGAKRKADSAE